MVGATVVMAGAAVVVVAGATVGFGVGTGVGVEGVGAVWQDAVHSFLVGNVAPLVLSLHPPVTASHANRAGVGTGVGMGVGGAGVG